MQDNYEEIAQRDFERRIYEECDKEDAEDDRAERSRAGQLAGVCKDCGNATMHNALNPAFTLDEEGWRCNNCYSTHLDLL